MSAALQLSALWGASSPQKAWRETRRAREKRAAEHKAAAQAEIGAAENAPAIGPPVSLAFYRKHTESTLRRYLYASMQVGRAPSILGEPIARGWASSRPVRTFEDAVIFVLDVETCLNQLGWLDRQMLCRIVLQEYTQAEAATLLGMSARTISYKFPLALDRLTERLLESGLLVLPG
jgi:DNA-directed RNA polymerase specialized sigma24 family protein